MRTVVLASESKRRKEIFGLLGIPFVISAHAYDEDNGLQLSPSDLVQHLAYEKARSLVNSFPSAIIVGSDTLVVSDGLVLPKPKSKDEAVKMLMSLSDTTHSIFTGYAIVDVLSGKKNAGTRETRITFRKINEVEARAYIDKEDVLGVAGAYDHEHLGAVFVSKLDGDYFSSIGLPLYDIALLLKNEYLIDVFTDYAGK